MPFRLFAGFVTPLGLLERTETKPRAERFAGFVTPLGLLERTETKPRAERFAGFVRHINKNRSDDGKMTTCRNALRRVTESRIGPIA